MGRSFEEGEGEDGSDRESENSEEFRNRIKGKYPELEAVNQADADPDQQHDPQDRTRLEAPESAGSVGDNELETLRRDLNDKYPISEKDEPSQGRGEEVSARDEIEGGNERPEQPRPEDVREPSQNGHDQPDGPASEGTQQARESETSATEESRVLQRLEAGPSEREADRGDGGPAQARTPGLTEREAEARLPVEHERATANEADEREQRPGADDLTARREADGTAGRRADGAARLDVEPTLGSATNRPEGESPTESVRVRSTLGEFQERKGGRPSEGSKLVPDLPDERGREGGEKPRVQGPTDSDVGSQMPRDAPERAPVDHHALSVTDTKEHRERVVVSTLVGEGRERASFAIPRNQVEDATGEKLEKGKEYEIGFRIEGTGELRTRHLERGEKRIFLSVSREARPDNLRFGEKYEIELLSVKERRDFKAMDARAEGPVVKVSRTYMESRGFQVGEEARSEKWVIDFQFRNLSSPDSAPARYFGTFDTKADELRLRVGGAGVKAGDVLRLEGAKKYGIGDFIKEFDAHKGDSMKNVGLRSEKGRLSMEVEGRRFALNEPHLDTRALKAILTANIESSGKPIRFQFDGEKVSPRLFRDSQVVGVRLDNGLAIDYDKGGGETRTFRLLDRFDKDLLVGKIRPVSSPGSGDGRYTFECDPSVGQQIRARLATMNGIQQFSRGKGDISEELQRHMLSISGLWEEIADHGYDDKHEGCFRRGPDSLQRLKASGELYHVELKWLEKLNEREYADARVQAKSYLKKYPFYRGERVTGAYISTLDWDADSTKLTLDTERVWPEN